MNYGGLVSGYYAPRWALHTQFLEAALASGQPVDWAGYTAQLSAFELAWNANATNPYPVAPTGDALAAATALAASYAGTLGAGGVPAGYRKLPGSDVDGAHVDIIQAWNTDVGVLASLCDLDPTCVGFNSDGYLKNVSAPVSTGEPCDLYLKA